MMDIVPSANLGAVPPANAGMATNAVDQMATPGASASGAAATDGCDPADPTTSFASTLESRLKLMAVNRAASQPPSNGLAPPKKIAEPQDINLVDLASTLPNADEINPLVATDAANAAKTHSTAEDAASADAAPAISPTPPDPTLLALNTILATAALAIPQKPASLPMGSTSPAALGSNTQQGNDTSNLSAANASVSTSDASQSAMPATTAILAAESEKNGLGAANTGHKNESAAFQDMLNNGLASAHLIPAPHTQAGTLPLIAREVQAPLSSARWASDVGNQLSWMANNNQSRADLVLNPPQLGRIEVSINMNGDQATASFVSSNPDVRDALQGSLPRLREVLADAGVFLGQASIGAESFAQNQNGAEKGGKSPDDSFSSAGSALLGSANRPLSIGATMAKQGRGLIDLFA